MKEIDKYGVLKEKLAGICDDNNLVFSIRKDNYPFLLTIRPVGGTDAQQTMMEGMGDPGNDTGYISPDATLVFAFRDGDLTYKISDTFTISDSLFNKIKGIFKKMHALWMQYFFRDVHEHSSGAACRGCCEDCEDQEPGESAPEGEYAGDEFADFLDDAEPVLDGEEPEDEE